MGIKLLTSTPYYAQANGQVETANKVIISLIKKHVGKKPRNLHKTLDQALWACRTSPKEATGTTPFRLVYGHDAVLPVEIQVHAVRIQRQHEIPSEDYWSMMADELVELDEETMLALDSLQRQKEKVARAYNKKVKGKMFVVDDLVWRVILPMDRNDRVLGWRRLCLKPAIKAQKVKYTQCWKIKYWHKNWQKAIVQILHKK
ncbi:uncharacterized protein LOC127129549 [Lathyrus oleraceus]|uniref:uncharacterized protein LOC127129549 n=1 Tax=Pisum sativum TaxID=3888 RepID=UPI0021D26FE1|nr:uncharacterized protein LOC127129549 [Pisum sativum]